MAWISREGVRRQLAALGYRAVPEPLLDEFIRDLRDMDAQERDEEAAAAARPQPLGPLQARVGGAVPKRKTAHGDGTVTETALHAYEEHVLGIFDQLEQMNLDGFSDAAPAAEMGRREAEVAQVGSRCCPHEPKSIIRPRSAPSAPKTDVVRRGERFRSEWAARGVPCEGKHAALRWRVRQDVELNREPQFAPPRRNPRPNAYVVPTDKKRLPLRWAVREHLNHLT